MSEPLRILYHHRIRADDGQAVHVRELIAALRGLGHQVLECALVPKADAVGPLPAAAGSRSRGGLWRRLSLPRLLVEVLEIAYNHRGRAMLQQAAAGFRPHFVYERHALHCRAGLDVARSLGVPLLLEVNSPMVDEMRALGLLRFPRRAQATERAVLGGADVVLPVTRVLADLLQARGAPADRLRVVGNGAVPERYGEAARTAAAGLRQSWALPADACVVGFVGYVRPWHRLDLLLRAMTRPGLQAVHLAVFGRGPALPELQQQATDLGLLARVRLPGEVAPGALPAHLLACDVALIAGINAYASPLKLFDALAAGVPVLAPDQPNLRETIASGRNGLLFAADDEAALAAQLQQLVADAPLRQRLGAAGRDTLLAQRWTWQGNAERVVAAYRAVAGAGR